MEFKRIVGVGVLEGARGKRWCLKNELFETETMEGLQFSSPNPPPCFFCDDKVKVMINGSRVISLKNRSKNCEARCWKELYEYWNCRWWLPVHSVKSLPAMQETRVRSLGWEDPLEKRMASHFTILAWTSPWTEEPDGLQSMESQRVGHDWTTNTPPHTHTYDRSTGLSYSE